MRPLLEFWDSTIGKKWVMALTGLGLVGFVVVHMTGNLLIFAGADAIREYAELLRTIPELLWIARISLIVMAILHIIAAAQLTVRNRASRPVEYAQQEAQVSTFASRYMRIGGVVLLFFIIIHLGHFTTGWFNPSMVHMQPYGNVVVLFERSLFWVAFYVIAMTVLGLHLYHGIWAGFRTLGVTKPDPMPLERKLSLGVAVVVWAGFIAVPIAVMLGILD